MRSRICGNSLIDLGVTPGRTLWVQSSWNEFYNVPLRPSEMIDLLRDLLGPGGTLAMPAFPIDQNPDKVFLVDRAPVYTGLLCEVFRRTPDMRRSIHLSSSVCAVGPNADFLVRDHHLTADALGQRTARSAGLPNWTRACSESAPASIS